MTELYSNQTGTSECPCNWCDEKLKFVKLFAKTDYIDYAFGEHRIGVSIK